MTICFVEKDKSPGTPDDGKREMLLPCLKAWGTERREREVRKYLAVESGNQVVGVFDVVYRISIVPHMLEAVYRRDLPRMLGCDVSHHTLGGQSRRPSS
jgi:hypothetical protein